MSRRTRTTTPLPTPKPVGPSVDTEGWFELYDDVVANYSGRGDGVSHFARYPADPTNVRTLCGRPRQNENSEYRRLNTPTVITCFGCRNAADVPNPRSDLARQNSEEYAIGDTAAQRLRKDRAHAWRERSERNRLCDAVRPHLVTVIYGSLAAADCARRDRRVLRRK